MGALEDSTLLDAWYPVGSPVDIRRHDIRSTKLQGRQIDLAVHKTWISPSLDGHQLPVTERLGLVWTTLGRPNGPPQPLIEYYEVDRSTLNVSSGPVHGTGPEVIEDTLRMLEGSGGQAGRKSNADDLSRSEQDNDGCLLLRSCEADLGILGSGLECETRILSPHSAIVTFRHSSRPPGQENRKDFYAVFCQPIDWMTTVAHRVTGIVDLPLAVLDPLRKSFPFVPASAATAADRNFGSSVRGASDGHDAASLRSGMTGALRAWIDARSPTKTHREVGTPFERG